MRFICKFYQEVITGITLATTSKKKSLKENTLESLQKKLSEEFIATDLSIAMNHLAAILGKSIEEDLLDQIFNSFCIGK